MSLSVATSLRIENKSRDEAIAFLRRPTSAALIFKEIKSVLDPGESSVGPEDLWAAAVQSGGKFAGGAVANLLYATFWPELGLDRPALIRDVDLFIENSLYVNMPDVLPGGGRSLKAIIQQERLDRANRGGESSYDDDPDYPISSDDALTTFTSHRIGNLNIVVYAANEDETPPVEENSCHEIAPFDLNAVQAALDPAGHKIHWTKGFCDFLCHRTIKVNPDPAFANLNTYDRALDKVELLRARFFPQDLYEKIYFRVLAAMGGRKENIVFTNSPDRLKALGDSDLGVFVYKKTALSSVLNHWRTTLPFLTLGEVTDGLPDGKYSCTFSLNEDFLPSCAKVDTGAYLGKFEIIRDIIKIGCDVANHFIVAESVWTKPSDSLRAWATFLRLNLFHHHGKGRYASQGMRLYRQLDRMSFWDTPPSVKDSEELAARLSVDSSYGDMGLMSYGLSSLLGLRANGLAQVYGTSIGRWLGSKTWRRGGLNNMFALMEKFVSDELSRSKAHSCAQLDRSATWAPNGQRVSYLRMDQKISAFMDAFVCFAESVYKLETKELPVADCLKRFPNRVGILSSKGSLEEEGREMHHCVGGYWARVRGGGSIVLSIRTRAGGRSTLEITVENRKAGLKLEIAQHRALMNGSPHPANIRVAKRVLHILRRRNSKSANEAA